MRVLIWDFDNTLAHRPGLWSQALAEVATHNLPQIGVTREDFVPHLTTGFPWHKPGQPHTDLVDADAWWSAITPVFIKAFRSTTGVGEVEALELGAQVRAIYTDPATWRVFPDSAPALVQLSALGWKHCILSNHVPELPSLVASLGLASHFTAILTSATTGYEKPNPAAFSFATRSFPAGTEFHMVGDSYTADYQGAKAAGIEASLVRAGHPECPRQFPDLHSFAVALSAA